MPRLPPLQGLPHGAADPFAWIDIDTDAQGLRFVEDLQEGGAVRRWLEQRGLKARNVADEGPALVAKK